MKEPRFDHLKYLYINSQDEEWGIAVTTVGYQFIPPEGQYPQSQHPDSYTFKPQSGRILNEYQLVYITKGSGYFSSQSVRMQRIHAGTMILLFPGEWHSYYPDKNSGWDEYWVGFRGSYIDNWVEKHFFSKKEPLHLIGVSATIVSLYEDIIRYASQEKSGFQQMTSSIVLHILGSVYYRESNNSFNNSYTVDKINEARVLMKNSQERELSPEQIAIEIGVSYSWFRRMFREYTGTSPAQYLIQQKILRAKELLTSTTNSISEIAFILNFENTGQFSTFFRKKEGVTPSEFRNRVH